MSTPLMDQALEKARQDLERAFLLLEETPGSSPFWAAVYHEFQAAQARFDALLVEAHRRTDP